MTTPFISVNDLCMDFDWTYVLKNVSFEIPESEIMGVIGRSDDRKNEVSIFMPSAPISR